MALYEVVLNQRLFSQQIVNRWNYQTNDLTTDHLGAFKLAGALGAIQEGDPVAYPTDGLIWKIASLQNSAVSFQQLLIKSIYDPLDFYDQPMSGTLNGQFTAAGSMPSFTAFGFYTNRKRTDIARGMKRIAGVTIGGTSTSGDIISPLVTPMLNVAIAMSADLTDVTDGVTTHFAPTIVGKEEYTTPAGKRAYKYYPTEILQSAHWYQDFVWTAYANARSQTSRQVGKGK